MLRKKGFWDLMKIVTGVGFLFSLELLLFMYVFL